jgi:hypothetical protein
VLSLKGKYKGQKLTRLVRKKIAATIIKMSPTVPVITFVKYKAAIAAAMTNLMIRSAPPMFFFIVLFLVRINNQSARQYLK